MVKASLLLGVDKMNDWEEDRPSDGQVDTPKTAAECKASRKNKPARKDNQLAEDLYVLLHDLVYILAFVSIFFVFFVRMTIVNGTSMFPTLEDQDHVALLSNVWYRNVKSGDIVVALKTEFSDEPIVKRVIATEGQTVDIDYDTGTVYVDGVALEEDYINGTMTSPNYMEGEEYPFTVEEGHVFLMGDNRNNSYDSRYYMIGQVDTRCILGKVLVILFPGESERYGTTRDFGRIGVP